MTTQETAKHLTELLDKRITARQVVRWIRAGALEYTNLNVRGARPIYNVTKQACDRFRHSRQGSVRSEFRSRRGASYPGDPWVTC
jgi:hypothetical protein